MNDFRIKWLLQDRQTDTMFKITYLGGWILVNHRYQSDNLILLRKKIFSSKFVNV